MNYLLDTCVISEMVKPEPNRKVVEWVSSQEEDHLFLFVLTLAEIQKGVSTLSDSFVTAEQRQYASLLRIRKP